MYNPKDSERRRPLSGRARHATRRSLHTRQGIPQTRVFMAKLYWVEFRTSHRKNITTESRPGKYNNSHKRDGIKEAKCLLFLMWYSFHDHDDPLGINVQPKRAKTQP